MNEMVSDPAIEAAHRTLDGMGWHSPSDVDLISAARQALKPVRAWFQNEQEKWVNGQGGISPLKLAELAPLIFTSEELER